MKKEVLVLSIMLILVFPLIVDAMYINEIFYDPEGGLEYNREFIEIYFDTWTNLTNYNVTDQSAEQEILLEIYSFNSNYALIVGKNFNFSGINASIYSTGDAKIGNGLNNGDDTVILRNSTGSLIDLVNYTNFPKVNQSYTLERLTINKNSTDQTNWNQSLIVNGTKGRINSLTDNNAPEITLNNPEDNSFLNNQNINFTFAVIDNSNNMNCSLYLDDNFQASNETVLNNTLTAFELINLTNMQHTWNITCYDIQLNTESKQRIFTIDTTNPQLINLEESVTANSVELTFNTNEDCNTTIVYTGNTITNTTYSQNHSITLESLQPGTFYNYNITYCDQANNCGLLKDNFTTSSQQVQQQSGGGRNKNKIVKNITINETRLETEDVIGIINSSEEPTRSEEFDNNQEQPESLITGAVLTDIETDYKIGVGITIGIVLAGLFSFHWIGSKIK